MISTCKRLLVCASLVFLLSSDGLCSDDERVCLGRSGIVTVYAKRETFWDTDTSCGRLTYWKVSFVVDKQTELKYEVLNKADSGQCRSRVDTGYVFEVVPSKPYTVEVTTFGGAMPKIAVGGIALHSQSNVVQPSKNGISGQVEPNSGFFGTWVDAQTNGSISTLELSADGKFHLKEPSAGLDKQGVYKFITPNQADIPFVGLLILKSDKLYGASGSNNPRYIKRR